jgi:tetratricopeptide (TPR) repeat protein
MQERGGKMSQSLTRPRFASRIGQTIASISLAVITAVIIVGLVYTLIVIVQRFPDPLLLIFGFLCLIGIYPLSYLAYVALKADAKRKRIEDAIKVLGLLAPDDTKNLEATAQALYRTVYNPVQFGVFIMLIMAVSILVVLGYLNRATPGILTPEEMTLVFYGYLGAYVFSVQQIIRRYNTSDLQPQVYASVLGRMIIAIAVTFVGVRVINLVSLQVGSESAGNSGITEPQAWAVLLAFVIGVFPERGIRWFNQLTGRILSSPADPSSERPLVNLLGVSPLHAARLAEIGLDDAQNLATIDIRKLLVTTQFDTHEIVNWIDQAILYVKVGDKISRFRDAHIATFHELRVAVDRAVRGGMSEAVAEGNKPGDAPHMLAVSLGLSGPEELERLTVSTDYPNYAHIVEYYKGVRALAYERARKGLQSLLGDIEKGEYDDLLEVANRMLEDDPRNVRWLIVRGVVHYKFGFLDEALDDYSRAIEVSSRSAEAYANRSLVYIDRKEYNEAINDCTWALELDSTYGDAFTNRGIAYLNKGYPRQSVIDFEEAIHLNERAATAYYYRGVALNQLGDFTNAERDFERSSLLDFRPPVLWVNWGEALLRSKNYTEAINKLTVGVAQQDARLIAQAQAYRGYCYMNLGESYYTEARKDLEDAILKDGQLVFAYHTLGLLEAQEGNYEAAVSRYNEALVYNPKQFTTRYNLGIAYTRLNRLGDARKEFEELVRSVPPDSIEATTASTWLAENPVPPPGGAMESHGGNGDDGRKADS